jgi:TetR/AcrR family transcriptional regulator, transcriptional repressor for nem operon
MPRIKAFDETDIIEKAKNLFQLKGYEGTSMQDLVDTLQISRSSIYDTFGDKHQLYLQTLDSYCQQNAYALIAKAADVQNPIEFIENIFTNLIEQTKKDTDKKGCYVVNSIVEFSNRNTDVTEIVSASNKAFEKMLEKLLTQAQLKKQIAQDKNPKQLANFLFTIICGIRVNSKTNATTTDLKNAVVMALSVLH